MQDMSFYHVMEEKQVSDEIRLAAFHSNGPIDSETTSLEKKLCVYIKISYIY